MEYKGKNTFSIDFKCLWLHYRSFNRLQQYCILIPLAWLKVNIDFDSRYLELWTACIFRLDFIVLNVRVWDNMESKYPSIVFLRKVSFLSYAYNQIIKSYMNSN